MSGLKPTVGLTDMSMPSTFLEPLKQCEHELHRATEAGPAGLADWATKWATPLTDAVRELGARAEGTDWLDGERD